jgi:hypothetical protein
VELAGKLITGESQGDITFYQLVLLNAMAAYGSTLLVKIKIPIIDRSEEEGLKSII